MGTTTGLVRKTYQTINKLLKIWLSPKSMLLVLVITHMSVETWYCSRGFIKCADKTQCIHRSRLCDGKKGDCKDDSDEDPEHCKKYRECPELYLKCDDRVQCVHGEKYCNGESDCQDGSDENYCEEYRCLPGFSKCHDQKQCQLERYLCNGYPGDACKDGMDEDPSFCSIKDVTCNRAAELCGDKKRCFWYHHKCNGIKDCIDGTDEEDCPPLLTCSNAKRLCKSGKQCVLKTAFCDDHPGDCTDGSDESLCDWDIEWDIPLCPSRWPFQCAENGQCVMVESVCNDKRECADGSDEAGCDDAAAKFHAYVSLSSWSEAREHCLDIDGKLATPKNWKDNCGIRAAIKPRNGQTWWIGVQPFPNRPHRYDDEWNAWFPGQPDNFDFEDCAIFEKKSNKWHDVNCEAELPFVCEFKVDTDGTSGTSGTGGMDLITIAVITIISLTYNVGLMVIDCIL